MSDLNFYFDEAKKMLDLESDTMLGKEIGLVPQHIYRARNEGQVKIEALLALAEKTGFDIKDLLAAREETKAMDDTTRQVWNRLVSRAKRVGGILAIGAIMTGSSVLTAGKTRAFFTETHVMDITPARTQVYDFLGQTGSKDYRKYRILSFIRRLLRKIAGFFGTVSRNSPFMPAPSFR